MLTHKLSFLLLFMTVGSPFALAACNVDQAELIVGKNKFFCPLALVPPLLSAGTIRGPDVCASEGGDFNANRTGANGINKKHSALDINSTLGTDVLAAKPGRVAVSSNWDPQLLGKNMGNVIIIDHEDGDYSVYGHLNSRAVKVGDCVKSSDVIGSVGYTGNGACLKNNNVVPHLHFAVIRTAKLGLADSNGPISSTVKSANDWLEFGTDFWGNDIVDLGILDPEKLLGNISGCISTN